MRRVAATRVYFDDKSFLSNHVVELSDGQVIHHYPLSGELPMTEWLGGTIIIRSLQAYHTPLVLSPSELSAYDSCSDSHIQRL